MDETTFAITVFVVLLLVASGVGMLAKWVRVPYTLMLVAVDARPEPFLLVVLQPSQCDGRRARDVKTIVRAASEARS